MRTDLRPAHLPALQAFRWFSYYYGTLSGGRGPVR
jgi:hypothetical protein